jgi:dipeptidyl aminopeptidase/acylaminoacyl peptidase
MKLYFSFGINTNFTAMKKTLAFLFLSALVLTAGAQNVPSFEQVISLRSAGSVTISPDGTDIAFTVQTVEWVDNRYDTEIWLSKDGKKPFLLTNNPKGNSTSPAWSPDGKWISFLSDRGSKNQIYVISVDGGEAKPVIGVAT